MSNSLFKLVFVCLFVDSKTYCLSLMYLVSYFENRIELFKNLVYTRNLTLHTV